MRKIFVLLLFLPLFSLSQINNKLLPTKYSLKRYTPTVISQGNTGMCAAYALSNMRTIIYAINNDITNTNIIDSNRFSPFFLYYMVMGSNKNNRFNQGLHIRTELTKKNKKKIGALEFMQNYGIAQRKNVETDYLFCDSSKIWCYPNDTSDMIEDLFDARSYRIDSFTNVIIGEKEEIKSRKMKKEFLCKHWTINKSPWTVNKSPRSFLDLIFIRKRDKKGNKIKKRCHKNNGRRNKVDCKDPVIGRKKSFYFFSKFNKKESTQKEIKKIYRTTINSNDINYIKSIISHNNPLYIGFKLPSTFGQKKKIADMTGEITCGPGHAMVIVGYDDSLQSFELMNSWGEDRWGEKGFSWIKYDDMNMLYNLSIYQLFCDNLQTTDYPCSDNYKYIRMECQSQNFLKSKIYKTPNYKYINSSDSRNCYWHKKKKSKNKRRK